MNKGKFSPLTRLGWATSGVIVAFGLNGCAGEGERPAGSVNVEPQPGGLIQDDYVYYPGYNVYYNTHRNEYAYQEGGAWISQSAPRGVSPEVLRASPAVRMDFHDSPARHQAEVTQKYPKNWTPPVALKDTHKDGH